jgi:hypothetical protein
MNNITEQTITNTYNSTNCNKYKKKLPSFTPVIYNLSVTLSKSGAYTLVNVTGDNFLPNGITYINFGLYKNITVIYNSSNNISFIVPVIAIPGLYYVTVVNIYNGNLATKVPYSYLPNLNFSNSIEYILI